MIGVGYGSWSKMFGTGPANLLEAKVVTADGKVVIANECNNPDLFFALRGGGHGFGVVVSLTMRTHPLPEYFGIITGEVQASSDEAYTNLVETFLYFYKTTFLGVNYGEQFGLIPSSRTLFLGLQTINLTREEIEADLKPFTDWLSQNPDDYTFSGEILSAHANQLWSVGPLSAEFRVDTPYDPHEPDRAFFWKQNIGEISAYWIEYSSRFLKIDQILDDVSVGAPSLIELGMSTGSLSVHTNKAQFGASQWAVEELEQTAMHPSVKDSFGLVITGFLVQHYSPLVPAEY